MSASSSTTRRWWASSTSSSSSARTRQGQFAQAGRTDLADKEGAEIKVLEAYLPQRLSAEEIAREVAGIVAELGASGPGDMGKVMGAAKARLAGKADMGVVSGAVKQALSK